jgi:hypothetical protein
VDILQCLIESSHSYHTVFQRTRKDGRRATQYRSGSTAALVPLLRRRRWGGKATANASLLYTGESLTLNCDAVLLSTSTTT